MFISWAHITFWNGLVLCAFLLVVFTVVETYLRATSPFMRNLRPSEFVPGVGMRMKPHSEVQWTNSFDYSTVSRVNSLGFLDREPPSPERAASSCHIAVVGDSFVEAIEVPISDKMQVRLEEMAREQFPEWDVTTVAYGQRSTGQVQQLPWWDAWIRHRPPKLVVLVLVPNDFRDNRLDGRRVPADWLAHTERGADGQLRLVPPLRSDSPVSVSRGTLRRRIQSATWTRLPTSLRPYTAYWLAARLLHYRRLVLIERPPVIRYEGDLTFTVFALDQWQQRIRAAGAAPLVLLAYTFQSDRHDGLSLPERLKEMAGTLQIPVIDQADYILRQAGNLSDASFKYDPHWNAQGHQWAAEALLEWMAANPTVCRR